MDAIPRNIEKEGLPVMPTNHGTNHFNGHKDNDVLSIKENRDVDKHGGKEIDDMNLAVAEQQMMASLEAQAVLANPQSTQELKKLAALTLYSKQCRKCNHQHKHV
ncbi:unnamed protein product [Dovyalis caffra]|uniref:Uncharacterized protein n=1 Tax=Dovyalis caffra TaxID=77055 RepID=A0AAV1RA80_9ROSI|nr:unnamed protein product [Dovyalis caffra]